MSPVVNLVRSSSTALVLVLVALGSAVCEARRSYAWSRSLDTTLSPTLPSVPQYPRPANPFLLPGQSGGVRTPSGVLPSGRAWTARNALTDLIAGILPDPAIPSLELPTTTSTPLQDPLGGIQSGEKFSFEQTPDQTLGQTLARLFVRYVKMKQATFGKSGNDYIRGSLQLFRALCQLLNQKDPANFFCFSILNQPLPQG